MLKYLNFQKPLNLLMKIFNGHIFLKKVTFSKFRFRRIKTNFEEKDLLSLLVFYMSTKIKIEFIDVVIKNVFKSKFY